MQSTINENAFENEDAHHISCKKPTKGTMMGDGKHDSMHFFDTGRMSCQWQSLYYLSYNSILETYENCFTE